MRFARPLTALCALACTASCGSGKAGTDATGTDTDPTATTETETGTGESCQLPPNVDPSDQRALFTIRNERDVKIFVLPYSSFICNYGQVEIDVDGEPVLWHHAGTYPYNCSANLCGWGCSDGGATGFIINPGAEAEVEWSGGLWVDTPLPSACQDAMECLNELPDTCSVRQLVDGEYTVRVNLSEVCPVEDECDACVEDVCEVFFYEPSVNDSTERFEATALFPAGAEFVID